MREDCCKVALLVIAVDNDFQLVRKSDVRVVKAKSVESDSRGLYARSPSITVNAA
jgi:hypothetical protein